MGPLQPDAGVEAGPTQASGSAAGTYAPARQKTDSSQQNRKETLLVRLLIFLQQGMTKHS